MPQVEIRIYRRGAYSPDLELVETITPEVESEKRLTADRARRILVRTLPVYDIACGVMIERTEEGYEARRAVEPTEKCAYHYKWEHAVVVDTSAP